MQSTNLIFTDNLRNSLKQWLADYAPTQVYVLCDEHTNALCLPLINNLDSLKSAHFMTIPAGDQHKNVETLSAVWQFLSQNGATRKSVLLNVGGGMVSDLGGFAAASFKRGIDVINLPTTILAAVDASVGGKTGINFNGLKNEIGAFHLPKAVLFYAPFFHSLDRDNILSGFAEMLKHGLLSDETYLGELMSLDLEQPGNTAFLDAIKRSVEIKADITEKDPQEKGLRKALNLGHTAGHAFEALSHHRNEPVLHGYAIAWGLICELYLASKLLGFPSQTLHQVIQFVKNRYGIFQITCQDYPFLYEAMTHDKKNDTKAINFTLLSNVGTICLNQTADKSLIDEMLDFYRDAMGI